MKYGDLITSKAHVPSAQGPYMVLHRITYYYVCVALDNSCTINIPIESVQPFKISKDVLEILYNLN